MRLRHIFLAVLVLLLSITSGCGGGNNDVETPSFTYTPLATTLYVIYGHSVQFVLTPGQTDPAYTYNWTFSGGTSTTVTNPTFDWDSPSSAATCTITVTVMKAGTQVSAHSWTVYIRQASTYTVTVTKSSVPLQGAEINAIGTGYKGQYDNYIGTTDSNGQAQITVPSGTYTIRCTENGNITDRVDTINAGSDSFTFTL